MRQPKEHSPGSCFKVCDRNGATNALFGGLMYGQLCRLINNVHSNWMASAMHSLGFVDSNQKLLKNVEMP